MEERKINLSFTNHFIFEEVLRNKSILLLFLNLLLKRKGKDKIVDIQYFNNEQNMKKKIKMKGVALDIYAICADGTVINIELMNSNYLILPKRLRYYQTLIDSRLLKEGQNYWELKDTYIIVLCKDDPFGKGLAIYEKRRGFKGMNEDEQNDGTHVLLLNAKYTDACGLDEQILDLLNYTNDANINYKPKFALSKEIKKDVEQIIEDDSKREAAMKIEDIKMDAIEEGKVLGREEVKSKTREIASALLGENFSVEKVSKITGLTKDEIQKYCCQ